MLRMAEAVEAQAKEIERLRMELQRTNIKEKDGIPELTPGSLEEFLREERVTQWMRLCVGAMKEFPNKWGRGGLQRPVDRAGAGRSGDAPPRDHVLA